MDKINKYIEELNAQFKTGRAGEEAYRPALKELLEEFSPNIIATNNPKPEDYGIPDYVLSRRTDNMPVSYVETKDLDDNDLDGNRKNKEQFTRYKEALDCIVFTNYMRFHLYVNGVFAEKVELATMEGDRIVLIENNIEKFKSIINTLAQAEPQRITRASRLAEVMANKARIIADVIERVFVVDQESEKTRDQQLFSHYDAFKRVLIKNLEPKKFASIYAQTIVYGLFTACYHTPNPKEFDRTKATFLIPKTNPLLRDVFEDVVGSKLDSRIKWIVDDLVEIFRKVGWDKVMREYNNKGQHNDPMFHFYEKFLGAYNPTEKKKLGVYYTPQPIVGFIVRAVDECLKTDFDISKGLADHQRIGETHRVQILDPATGTGTFLAEIINLIHGRNKKYQGAWQSYVSEHLLDRLFGFELMMASYAIAHLKIDMVLQQTGYKHPSDDDRRLNIYLTNSLEKRDKKLKDAFSYALTQESNQANDIKNSKHIMVTIGNPPYSGESQNVGLGEELVSKYKTEPGTATTIRDTKWINSDEVKFIALAQSLIESNEGGGIVGYINPHTYLDGKTFRGMRYQLLRTFDKIYIINLHGNRNTGETKESDDENVFDIQQGVCINIFVKNGKKATGELAEVYYYSLYGKKRKEKYEYLDDRSLADIDFVRLNPEPPYYFFIPKDFSESEDYQNGFAINELFVKGGVGMCTKRDKIAYQFRRDEIIEVVKDFKELAVQDIKEKYHVTRESRDQKVVFAQNNIKSFGIDDKYIKQATYRPFDKRWTYFTNKSKGFIAFPVYDIMKNLALTDNVALVVNSRIKGEDMNRYFVTDSICDLHILETANACANVFPLYAYSSDIDGTEELLLNFNKEVLCQIESCLCESIDPQELFGYIYAILYCPTYRSRFSEFLKIDFPRIPYPASKEIYHLLASKGAELRHLHLLDGEEKGQSDVAFEGETNEDECMRIMQLNYTDGKVYINSGQYFSNIPQGVWDLFIGGYQPARKWLQERKDAGVSLSFDDIEYYSRIVHSLSETKRLMQEIDDIYKDNYNGTEQRI